MGTRPKSYLFQLKEIHSKQREENDKWAKFQLFNIVKIEAIEKGLLINIQFTLWKHGNFFFVMYQSHKDRNVDSLKMNLCL